MSFPERPVGKLSLTRIRVGTCLTPLRLSVEASWVVLFRCLCVPPYVSELLWESALVLILVGMSGLPVDIPKRLVVILAQGFCRTLRNFR